MAGLLCYTDLQSSSDLSRAAYCGLGGESGRGRQPQADDQGSHRMMTRRGGGGGTGVSSIATDRQLRGKPQVNESMTGSE